MRFFINFTSSTYKLFRPLIFLFNSEMIHNFFVNTGEVLGNTVIIKPTLGSLFKVKDKSLEQEIAGIKFNSPVGLSAGFDYQAKLYRILPSLSFGFETIGTITNLPYVGNPKPRLGRLVKSKSLMVNKGFKNDGIKSIVKKLKDEKFEIPVGISIGKTNTTSLDTQQKAVDDIISAFKIAEKAKLNISFYELNISCPNLFGNVDFYESEKLTQLLKAVFSLNLSKPVFIKMPISKTNEEIIKMMEVIVKFPVKGVILGNLQKDRNNKKLLKEEVGKFKTGNFSGKPTEERSNELISLAYKKYGRKLIIIGTGGIFSAVDVYKKIKLGASLVQLITGLIFQGPQLVSQINLELIELIKKDGFENISQAVGKNNK